MCRFYPCFCQGRHKNLLLHYSICRNILYCMERIVTVIIIAAVVAGMVCGWFLGVVTTTTGQGPQIVAVKTSVDSGVTGESPEKMMFLWPATSSGLTSGTSKGTSGSRRWSARGASSISSWPVMRRFSREMPPDSMRLTHLTAGCSRTRLPVHRTGQC